MTITSKYVNDHLKFIDSIDPEWGKAVAKKLLEQASQQLGEKSMEQLNVQLDFSIASYDVKQCVRVFLKDGHGNEIVCTHIGIKL